MLRDEIALLDLRHEAAYATGHPLFAANMAADRIALEAEARLPRKDVPIVVYDAGEGLVAQAADRLAALGYTNVRQLDGGLEAWRKAGFEAFQGCQFLRQGLWRTGRVPPPHAFFARGRSRRADGQQGQYQEFSMFGGSTNMPP